ncbi:hypothetical protein HR45_12885 [Shewanella mangrovi]|uniref:Fe-S protein n=1 Tax=Shewanella mangrovi TaxID=1515746 RepID=A0A094JAL9_9GAMM|nr:DUF1289 domain-containing protein [Shewanella mangrovi]KFZ36940.1 hypothetical protein HR45_12885 [Shewanella mangrovi]
MEQLAFFEIPSPCIGICQTDARGYCKGCMRSREERFGWLNLSNAEKENVIRLCKDRKRRLAYAAFKQKQQAQQAATTVLSQQNQQLDFDADSSADIDLSDFSLD